MTTTCTYVTVAMAIKIWQASNRYTFVQPPLQYTSTTAVGMTATSRVTETKPT